MKHTVLATLVAGALAAGAASAETLKVSSYLPPKHAFNTAITEWGNELAEKSGGALTLELYPAGQLGPVNRQFDLARSGAADMAIILHSATPGRFPVSELAGLPLSYPSAGDKSTVTSQRLTELAPEYLTAEHEGTKILWMAVTPPLKVHLSDTEPATLDAFDGLRVRFAGQVFQQVLEAVGAAPLPVQPGEVAESLAKGVIDGAMFPYEATQAFDLGPELGYSMEPGVASATFAFVMNQAKYDALSPELKALIDETTGPARAAAFGASWDAGEEAGRRYLTDEHEVKIVTLPEAELARFQEAVRPIVEGSLKAAEDAGKPARAFFDAYTR